MKPRALPFELDSNLRRRLGHRLIDLIDEYFAALSDRPVQLPASQRSFEALHNSLPELPADPDAVLEEVTRELIERGFHVPSANYFGLMNPTPAYVAVLAETLVAALNPQLATMARSQLASKIEQETLRRIAVNERLEMDLRQLEAAITADVSAGRIPFAVVATAGTTNSGAIDDLEGAAEICRRHKLWFHVDGAYGAAAVFSDHHRNLVRGIERADSVTIDPHKWLAMPFSAGVILTSQPEMLARAFGIITPYMPKTAATLPVDNFKISAQWSRRANALKLWLTIRVHGRRAYEHHINRQMA